MTPDSKPYAADASADSMSTKSARKMEALLPPARRIPTAVGALAVRDSGTGASGDTIVLWPSILADHHIYHAPIASWLGQHRLVIVVGPGHGDSGPAPAAFSMKQCGQAVADVLNQLGISKPVIVVGCSWGGLVAGEFAIDNPSRVKAVVMMNTPVHNDKRGLKLSDRFVVWGARWLHKTRVYQEGVARSFFMPKTSRQGGPIIDAFYHHLRTADGAALALSVRSVLLEREPLAPRMPSIKAPTLCIAGRFDAMYPTETLRDAALSLPHGRFEILDTSHISVVDQPETTTKLIDAFISSLSAESVSAN
ncbi:MAG: alpha/beta fold hydrolase [Burkholderiales bacterium]|nr:alpha/beta fold hydrolase [Burkholderiales bacterium]